jgi:signal transduction histidine kinase
LPSDEELKHTQELEDIGRLSAAVSHDINNLLSGILGYSELLLSEPSQENSRNFAQEIRHATKRAASLILLLLPIGPKCVTQRQMINLNEIIRELDKILRYVTHSDFKKITEPNLKTVRADPVWVKKAVIGLVAAVRNAVPEGGKFILKTENTVVPEPSGQTKYPITAGSYVLLTADMECESNGPNKPAAEPCVAAEETEGGKNPGLLSLNNTVHLCGGHLFVRNKPGHGATFRIYLPVADDDPQQILT